ncbi:MAG: formyltetrahydrofolate deformylase [Cyclobacteriaceae bacterium]|nr:formyltetrahydrofolate deformylase [Cyclobacteriaceae bacterium]
MQYILKIDCPDQKGLVHEISGILFSFGLNIIENEEFVDHVNNHFFMRSEVVGDAERSEVYNKLCAFLPDSAQIQLHEKRKKNIIIFATKEYHCIGDLVVRHHFGELKANIMAVVSNHNHLQELCEKFGLPFYHVSAEGLARDEHEQKILGIVDQYNPEFLVLAKYMRILTAGFTNHFKNRIINIHHSFLPAFIGAKPYVQAYSRGVKLIGATAHFVNDNLDEGPIIIQDVIHTNHKHDASMMARSGRDVEKIVLSNALKLVFDDRVFVFKNKTIVFE